MARVALALALAWHTEQAFSPCGKLIAAGSDKKVLVFTLDTEPGADARLVKCFDLYPKCGTVLKVRLQGMSLETELILLHHCIYHSLPHRL